MLVRDIDVYRSDFCPKVGLHLLLKNGIDGIISAPVKRAIFILGLWLF